MSRGLRFASQADLERHLNGGAKAPGEPRVKGAQRVEVDGQVFDSKREAARYRDLCIMQKGKQISGLRRQVPFPIEIKGIHVCTYVADFVYSTDRGMVVEDCKGFRTEIYRLKRKLVRACHGIEILET